VSKINILHLCLQSPYNDYWGYQDNLLPKYHRKLGHNVTVITTNLMHDDKGEIVTIGTDDYFLNDGQRVIRLDYVKYKPSRISNVFYYYKIYNLLCEIKPDFIMVHGLGNISVLQVVKYLKKVNKNCTVIADNHLDYNNGKIKNTFINKMYRAFLKLFNKYMQRYYKKVYGVTPWRVTYCEDVFGISPNKTDVLVMGADDENINFENLSNLKNEIRQKHNIADDEFLIVTGGKIDKNKNIHLLMSAVSQLEYKKIKLIVFGNCDENIKDEILALSQNKNIEFIGWIPADVAYDYFVSADLVVFPGSHSVLWEQACACGIPCVFKYYEGMTHVDVGGNCRFLYHDSVDEIKKNILEICENKAEYSLMKEIAYNKASKEFLYSEIAKKTIQCK